MFTSERGGPCHQEYGGHGFLPQGSREAASGGRVRFEETSAQFVGEGTYVPRWPPEAK